MKKVGNKGMVFGTAEEMNAMRPADRLWNSPNGCIGDAVVRADGIECISVLIGEGRSVLISAEGKYIDDDTESVAKTELSRVQDGAWIPMELYIKAVQGV